MIEKDNEFKESEGFFRWAKEQQKNPDFYWAKCFSAIEDPAFIMSANGVILLCNRSFEKFLDMPANDIIGEKCYTLVHRTNTFTEGCPFVKSRNSGKREDYILRISGRFYQIKIDPIFDIENKFAGAVHLISDVDDMLKKNAELAMLGKVIENSSDGVISTDLNCRITEWNEGAERIFGYQKDEVIGEKFTDLLYESSKIDIDKIIQSSSQKLDTERKDAKFKTKNEDIIDVSLGTSPVFDEREILCGLSFILTDHTKERKAEQNLLSFMAETVLRLEKPIEMIKTNVEETLTLYEKGDINSEELSELLTIQTSNAKKILENIAALKKAMADMSDTVPDIMKDFLRQ